MNKSNQCHSCSEFYTPSNPSLSVCYKCYYRRSFVLQKEEDDLLQEWLRNHDKTCRFKNDENTGAIGGRLTYSFTPTSIGVSKTVECACGEEVNVTY